MVKLFRDGWEDTKKATLSIGLPLYLARADIRQRYRRSSLGPFWITISTGVMLACIGIIFGSLFKSPMQEFLPFLAAGLIVWNFLASTITEATTVFVSAEPIIKQLPIPLVTHIYRMIFRNLYIFFHNILIFPIVLLCVQKDLSFKALLFLPGLLLLTLNLAWIAVILSIVCSRFRDLTQIVISVLQIFFYLTPIIWLPSLLPARADVMVLEPNPFYHLLAIVREPLLGHYPSALNWGVCIILCVFGWVAALKFFDRYRSRIAYWL